MREWEMTDLDEEAAAGIARSFEKLGRIGFWAQIVLAIIPFVIGALTFLVSESVSAPGSRFNLLGVLAFVSLLILFFTTFWFWRYRKLADRLEDMSGKAILRTVWTGLIASSIGISLSIIVMIFEVTYMLFRFLETPQGGVPVLQTAVDSASWISAIDMLSLLALVLTVAAEIIALVLGLLLLNRVWMETGRQP